MTRGGRGGGGGGGLGKLGDSKGAGIKEVERKLAEVELDRTLCMNRIAQLEEELDSLKESRADAMTDARLNNEFLGRGFADLQVLLESGFKQLEKFYLETGGPGHGGGARARVGDEDRTTSTAVGGGG